MDIFYKNRSISGTLFDFILLFPLKSKACRPLFRHSAGCNDLSNDFPLVFAALIARLFDPVDYDLQCLDARIFLINGLQDVPGRKLS